MKMYQLPFLSRALSIAIFSCLFATVSLNAAVPVIDSPLTESTDVDQPYTYTITATNSPTSFGAAPLPVGLTRTVDTISGTPTEIGVYSITLLAGNTDGPAFETLTLTVNAVTPEITSSLTASIDEGYSFSYQITANNDPTSYNVVGLGSFPGLSFDSVTGLISGIPTLDNSGDVFIQAINSSGTATEILDLTVNPVTPLITSATTASGSVGNSFTYQITANNYPTGFSATGLDAFPGLSLDAATGEISGVPTAAASGDVIISSLNPAGDATETLALTVLEPSSAPVISSATVVSTTKGDSFFYVITASDDPISFGAGTLPSGLSRLGDTIFGTPTETGLFNIVISATNESGTGSATLDLTVEEPAPVITSVLNLGGEVDQSFYYQITADNTPLSFEAYGLISGLLIDNATGVISGAPTVSGDFDVTIEATNAAGRDTALLRIIVIPDTGAGEGPTVEIITINGEDPLTTPVFDADTTTLTIVAEVEPDTGKTLEAVFVRWNNPPATAGGAASIVAELLPVEPIPATGPITFSGAVQVGFNPTAREIGGGAIDLEVVATQRSVTDVLSFGTSDSAMIEIAPLVEFLFPSEDLVLKEISVGEVFASVKLGTNAFQTITASISGVGVIDTIIDDDSSDNPNGIFNFLAETPVTFPDVYTVDIVATDSLGNTTRVTQTIVIDNAPSGPVVSIASPTPGFTNEVFTPAIFTWEQNGAPTLKTAEDGTVITTTYTYVMDQVTEGVGYYPRNATDKNIIYNFLPGGASVAGNTIVDGRLPDLADSLSIVFPGQSDGYGSSGTGVVDNGSDPGQPAQITLAAEFFQGDADLVSFKMFVNGADVTPGNGNLDPRAYAGLIDAAVIDYPASGSPAPGNYVVTAQVTDRSGNVTTSTPLAFEILPYEPLEIFLARLVGTGADPSDPILIGDSATFVADVSPTDQIQSVEIFESNSGAKLGDASRVQIDGNLVYRSGIIFNEMGAFKVFAKATTFNGQTVSSASMDITVLGGEFPEVEIANPLSGSSVPAGINLEILVAATDPDGQITTIEVFNGNEPLGSATPTGIAGQYRLNLTPSVADAGVLNLIARATDDRGNSTDSDVVTLGVVLGAVPQIEILSPAAGDEFFVGQPFEIRARIEDADGTIASATLADSNFFTRVEGVNGTITVISDSLSFLNDVMSESSTPDEFVFIATINSPDVVGLVITARDDSGNESSSAPLQFTVTNGIVPDVAITAPLAGASYTRGDIVTIDITSSDADGSVAQVEVFNGTASLGLANVVSADNYSFNYAANAVGTVNLSARSTDNLGNVGISNIETISIVTGAIPTVTITSLADGDSIKSGETLEISVDATDADIDGFITSVEVFNNDALLGLANPTGRGNEFLLSYRTSAADLGNLNLQARAVDNQGNVGYSAVIAYSVVQGAVPEVTFTSPVADARYTQGDSIALEITADAAAGFVTSVEIFNGDVSLGTALKISGDQYRYTIDTATAEIASGTLTLSARATDNLGNAGFAWLSVDLAPIVFSVSFTDPTSNLLELTAAEGEFFETSYTFTVEVGGIAVGSLQSLVWQLDSEDPVEQADLGTGLSFSQSFTVDTCATLLVTATNTDGVAVTTRVAIGTSFPDPVSDSSDFIDYIYNQIRGTAPSDTEKNAALADLVNNGDTAATRAELTAGLYPDGQLLGSRQTLVALVYKTVTGQWPTAAEMESALLLLETDPEALVSQTVEAQSGSINSGGSETFTFNYTAGTEVSIRVSPDGSNGNPLSDPTLTVNDPNGTFVGFSDDNFVLGSSNPLDAVLTFTATQSGDYTATVRGFSSFQSGDFAIVSTSVSTESNNDLLLARVLVKSLQDSYNGANGFLADTDVANPALSPQFVAQLYRNKHDVGITNFNSNTLGVRLTGTDEDMGGGYILPGYSGDVLSFVAAFALDTDLAVGSIASISTPDGFSYTSELFYGRPNNPLSVWNAAASDLQDEFNITEAVSDLLPNLENPDLTEYDGMTLEVALATIFTDPAFSAQFPGSCAVLFPVIVAEPKTTTTVSGTTSTLSVSASGGSLSYQWQMYLPQTGWQDLPGETNSSYTANYNAISDGGYFRVEISNGAGSVTSTPVQVLVDDLSKSYTLYGEVAMTWPEALAYAKSEGGYLLEINSYGELLSIVDFLENALAAMSDEDYNTFINNTYAPDGGNAAYLWLGGSDAAVEGEWRWASSNEQFWSGGVSGSAVNGAFNLWGTATQQNEPDNFGGSQDALALALEAWPWKSDGKENQLGYPYEWNDISADNQLFFIMEQDLVGGVQMWPSDFSPSDYLARYADLAEAFGTDYNAAWEHYLNYGVIEGRTHSDSFSVDDYLSLNGDLAAAFGSDKKAALVHWFNYGINEDRQTLVSVESWPSGFSPSDYLARYADLAEAFGADYNAAWEHYLNYGVFEGRTHSASFSVDDYLSLNDDLAAAFGRDKKAALEHWFNYGINEGRQTLVSVESWPSGFSPSDYLARYADLAEAFGADYNAAWEHYLNYGVFEGRTHSASFSVDDYLSLNGDLAAAFGSDKKAALVHWFNYGINEDRQTLVSVESWPSGFSPSDYLARYADLAEAFGADYNAAWEHYLNYGVIEGRTHSDSFSVDDYLSLNGDLAAAFGSDKKAALVHWFNYGINEDRQTIQL